MIGSGQLNLDSPHSQGFCHDSLCVCVEWGRGRFFTQLACLLLLCASAIVNVQLNHVVLITKGFIMIVCVCVCVCVWSGGGEVLHTTGQFVVTLRYCYVQLNHVVLITKGFAMIVCVCVCVCVCVFG